MMQFFIPSSRDNLLRGSDVNQYCVEEILTLRQIPTALQALRVACKNSDSCIVDHFDTFFSVMCCFKDLEAAVKEETWAYLLQGCKVFYKSLASFLDEPDPAPANVGNKLNATKMACYLLCQFLEMHDTKEINPITVAGGKGRKKKTKSTNMGSEMDWELERNRGVHLLLSFIQLSLNKLWDPPVAEEEFIGLVSSCCYKLLENPSIAKAKDTIAAISHIIGHLVKRYNHGLGASVKIDQLLKHFEFLTSPLVQLMEIAVKEHKCNNLISDVLREINNVDPRELARDTAAARAYSTFLVELAEKMPDAILPFMSLLVSFLDEESYMLRNGILGVMGEILVHHLSNKDLDDKQKGTRNGFFDKLEDHLHDVNAFVRSKVLQIWLRIVEEKCLPLLRQESVMLLVVGRLKDKSAIVRRHAIQLITVLMKSNPFAARLPAEELRLNYEKEKTMLSEMQAEMEVPVLNPEEEKIKEEWALLENPISESLQALSKESDQESDESASTSVNIEDEDSGESLLVNIVALLEKNEITAAIRLATATMDAFPNLDVFVMLRSIDDEESPAETSSDQKNEKTVSIDIMKDIFLWVKRSALSSSLQGTGTDNAVNNSLNDEVAKQQTLVQYLQNSLSFAEQVQECIPIICQLLGSKNTTDVLEAINFFVTATAFKVAAAVYGVRRMMVLIWSSETNIRDAVVSAYITLYLEDTEGKQRTSAASVVKNLSNLLTGCNFGDLASMEALMCELVKSGHIDHQVIQALWETFISKSASSQNRRAAINLISMCAQAKPDIVRSNIEVLVQEGLGNDSENDFLLVQGTCQALLKLTSAPKQKGKQAPEPFRKPADHELFLRLKTILIKNVADPANKLWMPLAESVVVVIYKLSENPDAVCADLMRSLMNILNEECQKKSPAEDNNDEREAPEVMKSETVTCLLARVLSVAGQVAFRQVIHLECDILAELKRRQALTDAGRENRKKNSSRKSDRIDSCENEEEMALAGASAEDNEAEYVRKICEFELLNEKNLLSVLHPLLIAVCSNSAKYNDLQLQTAASLALAKFMIVNTQFCASQLQLLFTLLEKAQSEVIRCNLIISLGDLTVRYPNLVEPWTSHLYARLRDSSPLVRKTTMHVLAHLILNDMVKVKGQISELAICIVDSDDQIAGLAKLFFHELAKKGNSMYNMPDIISRLSDPDIGVEAEHFRTIISYIFSHIEKSKHCESLTEKLCHRFRATRTDRQVRDLAFCLSQLTFTEKGLSKLLEHFPCYANKLSDDQVYNFFTNIISKSKQHLKQDSKGCLEELESKIEQIRTSSNDQDEEAIITASKTTYAAGKAHKSTSRKAKSKGGSKKANKENIDNSKLENDDIEDDDDDIMSPLKPKRQGKQRSNKTRYTLDSEEDDDDDLFLTEEKGDGQKEYSLDVNDSVLIRPSRRRSKGGKVMLSPMASPAVR